MPVDEVTVTAIMALPMAEAFTAVTEHIDHWWVREESTDTADRFVGRSPRGYIFNGAEVLAMVSESDPPIWMAVQGCRMANQATRHQPASTPISKWGGAGTSHRRQSSGSGMKDSPAGSSIGPGRN